MASVPSGWGAAYAGGVILIHRAVASPRSLLIAVGEVTADPHPSRSDRWPWQVGRRILHVCDDLSSPPAAEQAHIRAEGLRVMKKLSDAEGRLAVSLITAAPRSMSLE